MRRTILLFLLLYYFFSIPPILEGQKLLHFHQLTTEDNLSSQNYNFYIYIKILKGLYGLVQVMGLIVIVVRIFIPINLQKVILFP